MVADYSPNVRRDDFRLRAKYPFLKTRIFLLNNDKYNIYVENLKDFPFLTYEELKKEFEYSIKMLGNPSFLTESLPENFIQEIPIINDFEISKNFEGAFFTHNALIHFLNAKFNNYKIKNMTTDFNNKQFVISVDYSSIEEKEALQKQLNKLKLVFDFRIEKSKNNDDYVETYTKTGNPKTDILLNNGHIMEIPAFSMQPVKLDFIKRDETLWFENIDKVYSGEFKKENLKFWHSNKSACYMDFTNAPNIDLRNNLLMYDTIYVSIPLKEKNDILFNSNFTKENFFSLIEKNRLKILNIQQEERLDTDILKEAYAINQNSVVNRRALSLLSVIDLKEINSNYIFNNPEVQPYIFDISKELANVLNIQTTEILNFFYWPKQALRESFELFNRGGLWSYGHIGVNQIIQKPISRITQKDLSLEFMMFSKNVHLANALNATYFPSFLYTPSGKIQSLDSQYSRLIGDFLNFYKYATPTNYKSFQDLEETKHKVKNFISPIDIFDINTYIPFDEFEEYTSSQTTRNAVRVLFDRLSNMTIEEREAEIKKYNQKIKELDSKQSIKLLLSDGIQDIFGNAITMLFSINPILLFFLTILNSGTIKGLIQRAESYKTIQRLVKSMNNCINAQHGELSDIDILSQISRVARLKEF